MDSELTRSQIDSFLKILKCDSINVESIEDETDLKQQLIEKLEQMQQEKE